MNTSTRLPQSVAAAADDFIAALLQSEAILAYLQARTAMDSDEATQALLQHYSKEQTEFRRRQANGTLTQDQVNFIRLLQQQVNDNRHIAAFAEVQLPARALLDELTDELTTCLGYDFASIANASSC